jgi:hypothetical protein
MGEYPINPLRGVSVWLICCVLGCVPSVFIIEMIVAILIVLIVPVGTCYSPYSFSSRLSVLVLTPHSSSVGTILLRLVSLHVPRRVHFLFPFPLVTDLTLFSELPTGRGLIFFAYLSC